MATQAATMLAKGPLSSALGQWMFLGFGTFVIFTGDNGVSRAAQEIAGVAFRLATGKDISAFDMVREAALGSQAAAQSAVTAVTQQPQQPIVIHQVSPAASSEKGGWEMTIVRLGLASGSCWMAYIIFSNYLPDNIKEMMPVTRKFFESAVTSLGQGILRVKEALSEQISQLSRKQDELSAKQDETLDEVRDVRLHIDDVAVAISRCESSLEDAAGRQNYMSRGVRLLVRCVGDLLRPSDPAVADELERFLGGGHDLGKLECPGSPNLSEIGSVDESYHNVRALSLPRPRSRPAVTPPPGPSSASKATALSMLHSLNGSGRGGFMSPGSVAPTPIAPRELARSSSGPENEVPVSNSDSARFEGMDMEQKLRMIGNL